MTKTLNTIIDKLGNSPILAPVHEEPLFLQDGTQIAGKKAIISDDGGQVSVVGSKYQIVQTAPMLERFAQSIDDSGLKTDGLVVTQSISPNCVRSIVKFQFPEHTLEMREGDKTDLQIALRNSFDGTWPISIDIGGFRVTCANGQVFGDFIAAFRSRHTRQATLEGMVDGLENSIEMFEMAGKRWIQYRKKRINKEQGEDIVLEYLDKPFANDEERAAILDRKSERRDTMMDSLVDYGKDMGWNMLAAYNTLTDDASHNKEDALVQFDRGRRAAQVIETTYERLAA